MQNKIDEMMGLVDSYHEARQHGTPESKVTTRKAILEALGELAAPASCLNQIQEPAPVTAMDALREAEAALEVAMARILKADPGHSISVTSEAKALVTVRAALAATESVAVPDEREAFEAHAVAEGFARRDQEYGVVFLGDPESLFRKKAAEKAWHARAALAATPADHVEQDLNMVAAAAPVVLPEPDTEKSATYGMTLQQRILHVGGRDNAKTYIEFGSIGAVGLLVSHVLRDLPGGAPGFEANFGMAARRYSKEQQVRALLATGGQAQAVPDGWREQFATEVYADLAAADNQDVPLEEYPARILKVLDSTVGPRHPVVIKWRNDAIEQCIAIARKYCRDPESHKYLKQDLEALLTAEAAPQAQAEPVAWTVGGEITNWSRDFSKYKTQHYVRPVFSAPMTVEDARAAELLGFLQDQCIDLRCFTTSDGEDVGWRTVQHHMSEPRERVVSEVYGDQPRRAIREAMARIERDPYCTGPLHLEDDAAIAAEKGE